MPIRWLNSNSKKFLLIFAITFALYQVALAWGQPPFVWIFAVLTASALACCIWIKKEWVTYVSLCCMSFFAVGAVAEYYIESSDTSLVRGELSSDSTYRSNWQRKHPVLGYGPLPKVAQTRSQMLLGDTTLYDVIYTTNAQGWRITPEHPQADTAIVFFGCSFTIGEGVNDAESYPYQVGEQLGPQYQVFNFGFHGYGAHQALAFLENGGLNDIYSRYRQVQVFFLNIPGHELRSAGYSRWDPFGPRYVLEEGKAVRQGNFTPVHEAGDSSALVDFAKEEVRKTLNKSHLYRRLFRTPKEKDRPAMLALQCAILQKAQEVLRAQAPNTEFTVLIYPGADDNVAQMTAADLTVVNTRNFFPADPQNPEYTIQGDGHPTPLTHKVLSQGLSKYIQEHK